MTCVDLVGCINVSSTVVEPDSDEGELYIQREPNRNRWQTEADPELCASVVAILRSVYAECSATNAAWSRDLLACNHALQPLHGESLRDAIQERKTLETDAWKDRVAEPIKAAFVHYGWDSRNHLYARIAHMALGGDSGGMDIGTTAGGGILAADTDPKRNDVGYRGSIMTVIWRLEDGGI